MIITKELGRNLHSYHPEADVGHSHLQTFYVHLETPQPGDQISEMPVFRVLPECRFFCFCLFLFFDQLLHV